MAAAPISIDQRFVAACAPVVSSNFDTCGTVTRATINHLNLSEIAAIFSPGGKFADLDAWFLHAIEMKACGVRRYALYDWIMANADRTLYRAALNEVKAVGSKSLLQPFIFGKQQTVINRDYWKIVGGSSVAGYTSDLPATVIGTTTAGPLTAAQKAFAINGGCGTSPIPSRVIRVNSRGNIPVDANWFRTNSDGTNGDVIHIFTRKANGTSEVGAWRVLASAVDSLLSYMDVLIVAQDDCASSQFNIAPTSGVIIPGINNVNDYEKFCSNLPNIDPRKRVPFWVQTTRLTRCVDSEYKAVYAKLMTANPAFAEFGDLDLAQRNAQDELESQKRFVNAFFFNKAISNQQTLTLWENLEDINSVTPTSGWGPGLSGKIQGKRANFIGVREQLNTCGRVLDLQNNVLNFYEFLDMNYNIKRARETQGRVVKEIDWWTNSVFAANFATAAMQYYKNETLQQMQVIVQPGQVNDMGLVFDRYQFKRPAGIWINILRDNFFDDWLDEFSAQSIDSMGNLLLCLDIGKPGANGGTVYWAQIAANRKAYMTAEVTELAKFDPTFRCVMEYPTLEQTLTSHTGTAVVECPLASCWVENFSNAVPNVTAQTANPSYLNLY